MLCQFCGCHFSGRSGTGALLRRPPGRLLRARPSLAASLCRLIFHSIWPDHTGFRHPVLLAPALAPAFSKAAMVSYCHVRRIMKQVRATCTASRFVPAQQGAVMVGEFPLIVAGADVEVRTKNNSTPLHLAAIRGNAPTITTLLKAGAP